MALTVELEPDFECRLAEGADRCGMAVEEYAAALLARAVAAEAMPRNGEEIVSYWEREGVLGIWAERRDIDESPEYARALRRRAETR